MATVMPTPLRFLVSRAALAVVKPRALLLLQMLMLCITLHASAAAPESDPAQDQAATGNVERVVKAAYLYKFLGYVEWPPAQIAPAGVPFVIGVAGNDALAGELERLAAGRVVKGRKLLVRRMRPDEPVSGLHLLYIGSAENMRQQRLLKLAQQHPILTVTDSEPGSTGAIINFKTVDNRVRFEVALGAAERSGLQLSSRLLSVALKVQS
jgi:hypothetical protein